jgi:hypothetical protein
MTWFPRSWRYTIEYITSPVDDPGLSHVYISAHWLWPGWLIRRDLTRSFKPKFYAHLAFERRELRGKRWTRRGWIATLRRCR